VTTIRWTLRARGDLAAIRAYLTETSPAFAALVVARIITATDRLIRFPESGRVVPELGVREICEVIHRPYRIVYRLVGPGGVHILAVHHGARDFEEPA
jgi:plasmid stabilization system protein ParE